MVVLIFKRILFNNLTIPSKSTQRKLRRLRETGPWPKTYDDDSALFTRDPHSNTWG